eukprot:4674538-Prymnesium_polylepis.1
MFPRYELHVLYNGASMVAIDAKDSFVKELISAMADAKVTVVLGEDNLKAFADERSVAPVSEQVSACAKNTRSSRHRGLSSPDFA